MTYPNLPGKKIALGVCGGIAAYKVAGLARELTQAGADVHVVMTPSATNFVGPITFSTLTGNPVRLELFPATAPTEIPHTDLGRTSRPGDHRSRHRQDDGQSRAGHLRRPDVGTAVVRGLPDSDGSGNAHRRCG